MCGSAQPDTCRWPASGTGSLGTTGSLISTLLNPAFLCQEGWKGPFASLLHWISAYGVFYFPISQRKTEAQVQYEMCLKPERGGARARRRAADPRSLTLWCLVSSHEATLAITAPSPHPGRLSGPSAQMRSPRRLLGATCPCPLACLHAASSSREPPPRTEHSTGVLALHGLPASSGRFDTRQTSALRSDSLRPNPGSTASLLGDLGLVTHIPSASVLRPQAREN